VSPLDLSAQRKMCGQNPLVLHKSAVLLQNGVKRYSVMTFLLGKTDTDIVVQITIVPTAAIILVSKIKQDLCISVWIAVYIVVGRPL